MEALETANIRKWSLEDASESDIFITSLVTFHLYATKTSGDKCIL
jgi:hypothetical protein